MRVLRHAHRIDLHDVPFGPGSTTTLVLPGIRPWRDTLSVVAVVGDRLGFDPTTDSGDGSLFVYGAGERGSDAPQESAFDGVIEIDSNVRIGRQDVRLYVTDIAGVLVPLKRLGLTEVRVEHRPMDGPPVTPG